METIPELPSGQADETKGRCFYAVRGPQGATVVVPLRSQQRMLPRERSVVGAIHLGCKNPWEYFGAYEGASTCIAALGKLLSVKSMKCL